MDKITRCLIEKDSSCKPIWFMRQAGRYLPEFRKIRKLNPNFIKLCLNSELSSEITLQPIKKFDLDAAIIFSDILIVPFALGQQINFDKNHGPILSKLKTKNLLNTKKDRFISTLSPIYTAIEKTKKKLKKNKALIGFIGAPWTLLVYMFGLKNKNNKKEQISIKNQKDFSEIMEYLNNYLCLHIERQVNAGANVIQIFDSWSGLIEENKLIDYCFKPNLKIVNFCKKIGVPVITFPKGIKNKYKDFVEFVKPNGVNIDPDISPSWAKLNLRDICIQGGMSPNILVNDLDHLKNTIDIYLEKFKNTPYIFNLGHGILPETDPETIKEVIRIVRNKNG
tara:strand:- start:3418 stop:4428 length:1011 start_codon:yes stop_codon:yes gene_type:complete